MVKGTRYFDGEYNGFKHNDERRTNNKLQKKNVRQHPKNGYTVKKSKHHTAQRRNKKLKLKIIA